MAAIRVDLPEGLAGHIVLAQVVREATMLALADLEPPLAAPAARANAYPTRSAAT